MIGLSVSHSGASYRARASSTSTSALRIQGVVGSGSRSTHLERLEGRAGWWHLWKRARFFARLRSAVYAQTTVQRKRGVGVGEANGDRELSDDGGLTEDRESTGQSGRADRLQA